MMCSSRSLVPLEYLLPIQASFHSEDSTSPGVSESGSTSLVFDMSSESNSHCSPSSETSDIWWSSLGDKGLFLNSPNCLQDLEVDEGYVDYSSTYSSGVLSPDLDFIEFKSNREFKNENTHEGMNTPELVVDKRGTTSKSQSKVLETSPQSTKKSNSYFDDCSLLSLPPSPELTNCFDILLQSPFSCVIESSPLPAKSMSYFEEHNLNFDRKLDSNTINDLANYMESFDASFLTFEGPDLTLSTNHIESQNPSKSNNATSSDGQSNYDVFSHSDLLNISILNDDPDFIINDFQDPQPSYSRETSCLNQRTHESRVHLIGREDHGYAAKLPAASTNRGKKRGPSKPLEFIPRSSYNLVAKTGHFVNTPSSVLEIFLTSDKTPDPNKGSSAALASEMKRFEKVKSERLLKKLLTADVDRRRNEAKH